MSDPVTLGAALSKLFAGIGNIVFPGAPFGGAAGGGTLTAGSIAAKAEVAHGVALEFGYQTVGEAARAGAFTAGPYEAYVGAGGQVLTSVGAGGVPQSAFRAYQSIPGALGGAGSAADTAAAAASGGLGSGVLAGGAAGLPGAGSQTSPIAFEFTGAAERGLLGEAGSGALGAVATQALQPSGGRPRLNPDEGAQTVEVPAVPVRILYGLRRVGYALCYFAERNVSEAKIRKTEGLRAFNRTAIVLPPEFAPEAIPGVQRRTRPTVQPDGVNPFDLFGRHTVWTRDNPGALLWPTAQGSGSTGVYVGLLCDGRAGEPVGVWFGGELVVGAWSRGAFRPTVDGEQRQWTRGYKGLGDQDDDIFDFKGRQEPFVADQPELLLAFGDGTNESNVGGPFGRLMRAMTSARLFNPEDREAQEPLQFSFAPPPAEDETHDVFSVSGEGDNAVGVEASFELNDWLGPNPTGVAPDDVRLPKWDSTHTAQGVSVLATLGNSRHQAAGPGILDAAQVLLPGPSTFLIPDDRLHVAETSEHTPPTIIDAHRREYPPIGGAPPETFRNAADARFHLLVSVRRVDALRINTASYLESRFACGEWLEHLPVAEGSRIGAGLEILRATYGMEALQGQPAAGWQLQPADELGRAIRLWNRAYAGPRNADIRYPADMMFESPEPAGIEAIEGALDECWLGRVVELNGQLHFRAGFKRPTAWEANEDDLADEPEFTVVPVDAQIMDAYDLQLPQSRNHRHEAWTRRLLRPGVELGQERNVGQGPDLAAVTGVQHAHRLGVASMKRSRPGLIRFAARFLLGDGAVRARRMATLAGDVIEVALPGNGLAVNRYEVASVDRSQFRMGVIGLLLAEEPDDLWDDEWDYQSPILDNTITEGRLGVIHPQRKPTPDLTLDDCPRHDYGHPGMEVRVGGILWRKWWDRGWPDAGTAGVVWSLNGVTMQASDQARAKRLQMEINNDFTPAQAAIDGAHIDGSVSDPAVIEISVALHRDGFVRVRLDLGRASQRTSVDFLADLEPNVSLVFRRADGQTLHVNNNPEDAADPYVWRFNIGSGPFAATASAVAAFFEFELDYASTTTVSGVYDVAIVDRRRRCRNEPDNPWYPAAGDPGSPDVALDPLRADPGGPYEAHVHRQLVWEGGGRLGQYNHYRYIDGVVNLMGSGVGGMPPYQYEWRNLDGATVGVELDQANVTVSYRQPGSYTAHLRVTDAAGATADAVAQILIQGAIPTDLVVQLEAPGAGAVGRPITVRATLSGVETGEGTTGAPTFSWSVVDESSEGFAEATHTGAAGDTEHSTTYTPPSALAGRLVILRVDVTLNFPAGPGGVVVREPISGGASGQLEVDASPLTVDVSLAEAWRRDGSKTNGYPFEATVQAEASGGRPVYGYAWTLDTAPKLTTAQLAVADVDAAAGPVIARATGAVRKTSGQIRSSFSTTAPQIPTRYMVNERTAYLREFRIDTSANTESRFVIGLAEDRTTGSGFDEGENLTAHALLHFFAILHVDGVDDVEIQMLGTVDNTEPYDFFAGDAGKAWADAVQALPAARPRMSITIYDDTLNNGARIKSGAAAAEAVIESTDGASLIAACEVADRTPNLTAQGNVVVPQYVATVGSVSIGGDARWRLKVGSSAHGSVGAVFAAVLTGEGRGGAGGPYDAWRWLDAPNLEGGVRLEDGQGSATVRYEYTATAGALYPPEQEVSTSALDATGVRTGIGRATIGLFADAPEPALVISATGDAWERDRSPAPPGGVDLGNRYVAHPSVQVSSGVPDYSYAWDTPTNPSVSIEDEATANPTLRLTHQLGGGRLPDPELPEFTLGVWVSDEGTPPTGETVRRVRGEARVSKPSVDPRFGVRLVPANWVLELVNNAFIWRLTVTAVLENQQTSGDLDLDWDPTPTRTPNATQAVYERTSRPDAQTTITCSGNDGTNRDGTERDASGSLTVQPYRQAESDLTVAIAQPLRWALSSGTAGTMGAAYTASPTFSTLTGGSGTKLYTWFGGNSGVSISGARTATPTYSWTAAADGRAPPSPHHISVRVRDHSLPAGRDAGGNITIAPPPTAAPPISGSISVSARPAADKWALARGEAGKAGAIWHKTAWISNPMGGAPPLTFEWSSSADGVAPTLGSANRIAAAFAWTAEADGQYPPEAPIQCIIRDSGQGANQRRRTLTNTLPAHVVDVAPPPPPPPPPTPSLRFTRISIGPWFRLTVSSGVVIYAASANVRAQGGSGGIGYQWRGEGDVSAHVQNPSAGAVQLRSPSNAAGQRATVTATDSAGGSVSRTVDIPSSFRGS